MSKVDLDALRKAVEQGESTQLDLAQTALPRAPRKEASVRDGADATAAVDVVFGLLNDLFEKVPDNRFGVIVSARQSLSHLQPETRSIPHDAAVALGILAGLKEGVALLRASAPQITKEEKHFAWELLNVECGIGYLTEHALLPSTQPDRPPGRQGAAELFAQNIAKFLTENETRVHILQALDPGFLRRIARIEESGQKRTKARPPTFVLVLVTKRRRLSRKRRRLTTRRIPTGLNSRKPAMLVVLSPPAISLRRITT